MEKSSGVVDAFHEQEADIDKEKLFFSFQNFCLGAFSIAKNIYDSFADGKSKSCFFNIIMSFINGIILQVKIVFTCSIQPEKENMPENRFFYLNQGRFSYKGYKKTFYGNYFI